MSLHEPAEQTIHRLEAELAAAIERANVAETQLSEVHVAVRAFKEKQERVAMARKARKEQALVAEQAHVAQIAVPAQPAGTEAINISMSIEAWESPDPGLDERLNRYLENDLEPDRSREWMLS